MGSKFIFLPIQIPIVANLVKIVPGIVLFMPNLGQIVHSFVQVVFVQIINSLSPVAHSLILGDLLKLFLVW